MVVLVGKQAANQACVSNPHSPPGTAGRVTDTNRLTLSVQRVLRGGGRRWEAGREEEDEEWQKQPGFGWRWGQERAGGRKWRWNWQTRRRREWEF